MPVLWLTFVRVLCGSGSSRFWWLNTLSRKSLSYRCSKLPRSASNLECWLCCWEDIHGSGLQARFCHSQAHSCASSRKRPSKYRSNLTSLGSPHGLFSGADQFGDSFFRLCCFPFFLVLFSHRCQAYGMTLLAWKCTVSCPLLHEI